MQRKFGYPHITENEVDMKNAKENKWRNIIEASGFILFFAGILPVLYVLSISEPVKVLLLGATLVGLTVWAKRHYKRKASDSMQH